MLLRLASLLRYPDHPLQREVDDCDEISAFFDEIAIVDRRGLEELYTTTFDLNPVATLEVGWHLWGEQYERGRFLADLRGIQERIGLTEATELPDHLTLLLPTIAATDDEGLREKCVKGLEKILAPLEEHGNPYRHLLRAVREACQIDADRPLTRPLAALGATLSPLTRGEGQLDGILAATQTAPTTVALLPAGGGEKVAPSAARGRMRGLAEPITSTKESVGGDIA